MPSTTARLRAAAVGSGSGNRQESHSANTPSSLRTPVARIAAVFTHSVWWSCAHSAAGRSPVTSSSAAAVGSPSAHVADSQPWPSSQPSPGSAAPIAASASARLAQCVSSSRPRSSAHSRKWAWLSVKPGSTQRPSRSSRSCPTVSTSPSRTSTPPAIRSPATASADTCGRRGSIV